jgi:uncharacterized secreted protein with C-terminal beta-propeller domain
MEIKPKASRALPILAVTLALTGGLAWATGLFGSSDSVGPQRASAAALKPFESCDGILDYVRDHRWALGAYAYAYGPRDLAALSVQNRAIEDSAGAPDAVGSSATGTNVQEAGIDEPDIAKLAGDTLYVINGRRLQSFDVAGDDPELLAEVDLGGRTDTEPQLLIAGDRAFVLAATSSQPDYRPATRVVEVDISTPDELALLRTAEIEGAYLNARLRGETAHLVIAFTPDYPIQPPEGSGNLEDSIEPDGLPAEPEVRSGATGETGPAPDDPKAPAWLPTVTITDAASSESTTEPLVECDAIAYPERFAGLGMVSVLTIDTEAGLPAIDSDSVMTNGRTIYASASNLYVATETVPNPGGGVIETLGRAVAPDIVAPVELPDETAIHRFDISSPGETSYAASGEVEGRILNEWSLSEQDGFLRVAATKGDPWTEGPSESETAVTVLDADAGELTQVGRAGGLGRGETIFGVRFIGAMGYVVTFEQTDPLYTIDLSDPENPRTTGELKIPGYSAYLHPVGDGRLLGIGQSGTSDGRLTGAQASLFDVSDAAAPERIDTLDLTASRYASAEAEWDSHAFLYSPADRLAVVPVTSYERGAGASAVAFQVSEDGSLAEPVKLDDGRGQIRRMLVAGERLITVSTAGVASRPLAELG